MPASPYGPGVETVVITRATYKFPQGVAQQMEPTLRQFLDDEIEIRLKGDALQITASDEDQAAIAQLLRLIERKARHATKGAVPPTGASFEDPFAPAKPLRHPKPNPEEPAAAPAAVNDGFGDSPVPRKIESDSKLPVPVP